MRAFAAFLIVASATPAPRLVRPRALLDHRPYLGVARVGLAVGTRRDVDALRGRVGRRPIALDYVGPGGSAAMFVGYVRPAGLRELGVPARCEGAKAPSIRVRLWATEGDHTTTTSIRVPLHAGWG